MRISLQTQLDPLSKNAIAFDAEGAGVIKLRFDASQMPEAMKLAAFGRGKILDTNFEAGLKKGENEGCERSTKTYSS